MALQLLAAKGVPSAGERMHVPDLSAAGAVLDASKHSADSPDVHPRLYRMETRRRQCCGRVQTECPYMLQLTVTHERSLLEGCGGPPNHLEDRSA